MFPGTYLTTICNPLVHEALGATQHNVLSHLLTSEGSHFGADRTGGSSVGHPLSPQHVSPGTPVRTAEGSHLEHCIPAFYLGGSDISDNTHPLLRLSP